MSKPNHTCQICGKPYFACRKCEDINSPRQTTDKNECYAIYVILVALRQGVMTNEEAKEKLVKMGHDANSLSKNQDKFLPEIYDWLVRIVDKPKSAIKADIKKK